MSATCAMHCLDFARHERGRGGADGPDRIVARTGPYRHLVDGSTDKRLSFVRALRHKAGVPRFRLFLFLPPVALAAATALSQVEGVSRGVTPLAGGGAFEVTGIQVDVGGATAEAARLSGWRLAQRKAWGQLSRRLGAGGGAVGDGTLDQLVTGILVEREQIGPKRYIATLGVQFDRIRAASLLGVSAYLEQSPPMLVIPVQFSGGTGQVFESRTRWQEAWARFRTGNSAVDYIRPAGNGADPLLLTLGQTTRPGRGWWRAIIDQYGATDVLIPTVRLQRQWPGGPVIGQFQARYGPDNRLLGSFALKVGSADGLPQLLDAGVRRLDALYARGFREGAIVPDGALRPPPAPERPAEEEIVADPLAGIIADIAPAAGAGVAITVQFDTPSASSIPNTETAVRGIPGVRQAATTSTALGGVSVMRVVFDGDPATLRTALESRGWQVVGSGQTIRIRRAPQLPPPDLSEAG